ncbi:MAG: hypothetical protein HC773_03130 [Scytonema sp. CRU_2_7]|jgi:hypothetical protein|nr:hypothetical protein [Scytonema sp. CRU_2_7]
MTDIIAKGGRGLKAPYETTHARIPKDAKAVVEKLSAVYRQKFIGQVDPDSNGANLLLEQVEKAIDGVVVEKPVNKNYQEVRDRILKRVRSDKLKAVAKALDDFIAELEA